MHRDHDDAAHPAAPEQPHDGFATGAERRRDAREDREPDFARGRARRDPSSRKGRFSEGAEAQPDTPQKRAERTFAEGAPRGSEER